MLHTCTICVWIDQANLFLDIVYCLFLQTASSFSHLTLIMASLLDLQQEETVTKRTKLPCQEETDMTVTRNRRRVQEHHCDIIGEQFWQEHPDILERENP